MNLQGKGQDVEQNADEEAEGNKDDTTPNAPGTAGQDNSNNQAGKMLSSLLAIIAIILYTVYMYHRRLSLYRAAVYLVFN